MYFLGIDLGSSFVKARLLDGERGVGVSGASYPATEMPVDSPAPGWAEQSPQRWWEAVVAVTRDLLSRHHPGPRAIGGIGIAYQMHGLVLVDAAGEVLRPSIIWCDSRAVGAGEDAFARLGEHRCLGTLLNSPGNFTAAKLAWVRKNEPEVFARCDTMMLPGDWVSFRLTGERRTTVPGLSEGMLWDFSSDGVAEFLLDDLALPRSLVPAIVPTFGEQGRVREDAARELGLEPGIPVTYRAGDQPNSAFSLGVLEPGEIAATAGTSGVIYGVSDAPRADRLSRVNTFAHVNHSHDDPRLGILLCLNGAGSAYRWLRQMYGSDYEKMNVEAATAPPGASALSFLPFGNGAERVLGNQELGASFHGIDFNRHEPAHLTRAVLEGVAFGFRYGVDILRELSVNPSLLRAGAANMFSSPVFAQTLSNLADARIELYRTDGAEGAARGAAVGAGLYATPQAAVTQLAKDHIIEPQPEGRAEIEDAYGVWLERLRSVSPGSDQ